MQIETEIKFSLDAGSTRKILSSRLIRQAITKKRRTKRYRSTYYDTRQHRLRKAGVALRVREIEGEFEQTLKLPVTGNAGLQQHEEWTLPLAGPRPSLARFDKSVLSRINPRRRPTNLLPLFTTEIDRIAIELAWRDSRFELAIDRGSIISHGKRERKEDVSELELELLHGDPADLLDFAIEMNEAFELVAERRTKAQRGYALVRPSLRPRPTKAKRVHLEPNMNAGEAFHRIIADALRQLDKNEIPTIQGIPGGIHQARVSIRRIRAALRAFKKELPYDKRKAFNGEFRWFQQRLAPARDWHVFRSETLPQIQASRPNARVNLDRLQKLAVTERRRATRDAAEVFRTRRYGRLILQFQRWLLTLERENPGLETPVPEFAVDVLKRSRRCLLLDSRPLSRMTLDELHELRKRGKKTRYAAEFFADLWTGETVQSSLKSMARLQDLLGKANDASVARQVLASVPPRALKPSAITLVQNWSDERSRHCIRSGQPVWRKIHSTEPFWQTT